MIIIMILMIIIIIVIMSHIPTEKRSGPREACKSVVKDGSHLHPAFQETKHIYIYIYI